MQKSKRSQILSIPNILTFIRIVLIPVCIVLYFKAKDRADYIITGSVLALSCITDMFDGLIARKFNMITTLGKILDPIADKGTQFAMIICLSVKWPMLFFILPLFIIKEGFQFICGAIYYKKGKILSKALLPGKICTTVMFVSMIAIIAIPNITATTISILTALCCVFLAISFISYILAYFGKNKKLDDLEKTAP